MKGVAILGLAVLAFVGVILFYRRSLRVPDQIEPFGPFGLVTRGSSYALRYKEKPFSFVGKSGMYGQDTVEYDWMNSLITFPSAEPVVVVNVGDPNNSSFYYLVREVNGVAVAEFVADGRGGVSAEWLDAPDDSKKIADVALHRGRMEGGRFLLLGEYTVLDTRTLKSYTFTYNPEAGHNNFKPPMELSPDGRSFVRWGSTDPPESHPALIVYDFMAPSSYYLRLDRTLHRFHDWEEVDRAWLHHYFEWKKGENGFDQLVMRENVTPMPYRGKLSASGEKYQEYRIQPVTAAMKDSLAAFIEREMGGVRQPPEAHFSADVIVFKLGEHTVHVSDHEDHASVYSDHESNSGPAVAAIAKRFDEELKTRKYDHLFAAGGDE
jgi:hypothetical protein